MAIPPRQIGQSTEANLLYNLSKQLNNLTITISAGLANVLAQAMAYTDAGLATKQDTLISGVNIKTINGNTILGAGDIIVSTDVITVVANYSALPPAATVTGDFFWVENSQGTQWLPGSLGGTYYPLGLYYSNGVTYEFVETPYQAIQAEVDAGLNNNKFVTPLTLRNSSQWLTCANLSYLSSPTNGTIVSENGTDAVIPATDFTNAGLFLSEEKHLLYNDSSTGATRFDGFTINVDNTKYDVGVVEGWFVNNHTDPNLPTKIFKSFPATLANTLPNIATQNVTYIAIDVNGVLQLSGIPFESEQQRSWIPLGVIVHSNRINVNTVNNQPVVAFNILNQLSDLMESIGFFNIYGNVISPNGVNLSINKSTGQVFKQGANFINDNKDPHTLLLSALVAPASIRYRTQTGTEFASTNVIDPGFYDLAGVRTAIPGTRWSIQRIYLFQSNLIRIQYGQATYTTQAEAIQAISTEAFVVEQNILENGLFRGLLVVREGVTDLTDLNRALFITASKFGSVAGLGSMSTSSLQQAYNNSLTPEITTNSTLGALSIQRGSASDTDNVLETQNGAGVITASIKGNGVITSNAVVSAASLLARGTILSPTLTATANNDILIGIDIAPTFNNGAFINVSNIGLKIAGRIYPASPNTYSNGDSTNAWANVYSTSFFAPIGSGLTIGTLGGNSISNSINSINLSRLFPSGNFILQNGGTFVDAGYRLDVNGTSRFNGMQTFQGTVSSDSPTLGAELTTTGTGTNWTGTSFVLGYTHSIGSVVSLVSTLAAAISTYYQISYTVTGRTAGTISIVFGGNTISGITISGTYGAAALTTGVLTVTPTTDFDGTIAISIKTIGTSTATTLFTSSTGINGGEIRASLNSGSIFFGSSSGRRLTTGINNTSFGQSALANVTTGSSNVAIGNAVLSNNSVGVNNTGLGASSLLLNISGSNNTSLGQGAMQNSTSGNQNVTIGQGAMQGNTVGSTNVAIGQTALFGNTTGSTNVAIGGQSGRFIADGVTLNTIVNSSIFIGYNAKALADSQSNQIVIGHDAIGLGSNRTTIGNSSTLQTHLQGNITIGDSTASNAKLKIQGSLTASGGIAVVEAINTNLIASANNDVLIGLDVSPGFSPGAFTGVQNYAMRVNGTVIPGSNNAHNLGSNTNSFNSIYTNTFLSNAGMTFDTTNNNAILWRQNTVEKMRLFNTGNLLIQTAGTPVDAGYKLDINGTARVQGKLTLGSTATLKSFTVATLPVGVEGDIAYVTDATAPTYLGTLTGGGAIKCPVFYDGTAWVSH